MSFLFVKSMAQRTLIIERSLGDDNENETNLVKNAHDVHDFSCRRYFGFGFLLSFIPKTKAYKARLNLAKQTKDLSELIINDRLNNHRSFSAIKKYHYRSYLRGFFWGGMVNTILYIPNIPGEISNKISNIYQSSFYNFREDSPMYNRHWASTLKRLFSFFPIISDFVQYGEHMHYDQSNGRAVRASLSIKPDFASNLFHTLCNPLRLIQNALGFTEYSLYAILNLGTGSALQSDSKFRPERNPLRLALKVLVSTAASTIKFPLGLVSAITDLPYQLVLKDMVYEPLEFIASSFKQSIRQARGLIKREPVIVKDSYIEALKALNKHIAEQPEKPLISSVESVPSRRFLQLPINVGEEEIRPVSQTSSVCPLSPKSKHNLRLLVDIMKQPGLSMEDMAAEVEKIKEAASASRKP